MPRTYGAWRPKHQLYDYGFDDNVMLQTDKRHEIAISLLIVYLLFISLLLIISLLFFITILDLVRTKRRHQTNCLPIPSFAVFLRSNAA